MLEVEAVDAYYGDSHVLHAATISVGAAERVALLGRNGAGKSTLLKSVMNAGPRVRGRIAFDGTDLAPLGVHRRTRLGVALVPEDRRLFGHLTVDENIAMARYGASPGRPAVPVDDIIARFPMLAPLRGRHGGQLSGGQQQLVAVARGLAANPRLLLLDEPTEGLAPIIVAQMADDLVRNCRESRVGLLLCEQNIAFARRCTERVCVIDAGRIVFSGDWHDFDRAPQIQQRHLAL